MRINRITLAFLLGITPSLSWAKGEGAHPLRDRVAAFLESNVIGRTQELSTEGTVSQEGQTYLIRFRATIQWTNFSKTDSGLVFDQVRQIKQSNSKLDASGKELGEVEKTDREVVFHYALAERETTKSLVGLSTMTKNTLEDPTGIGFVTMLEISDDGKEVYLYGSQAGFVEGSLDGHTIVPLATASESTLFLDKGGKFVTNDTLKFYKVDVSKDYARTEVERFNLTARQPKN